MQKKKKKKRKEKKYTWDSRRSCVSSPVCSRNGGGRVWARGGGRGGFVVGVVIVVVVVVVMVKWRVSRKRNVDVTLTIRYLVTVVTWKRCWYGACCGSRRSRVFLGGAVAIWRRYRIHLIF